MRVERVGLPSIAAGLLAGLLLAGRTSAAELTAADVVARNVAARGGLDAWRKIESMVWTGRIESAHAPAPILPFRLEQKRPRKTRLELDGQSFRSVRVFDGTRGWKVSPGRGLSDVRPYTSTEVRFAQASPVIDGPLVDAAATGRAVTLAGRDTLGGRAAYHLKVRAIGGGEEEVWVDAVTFLELRYDRVAEEVDGSLRRVSATFGDWREVDGVRIPFLVQTGGGGPGELPDKMLLERVALNAPLDDSRFGNPADPRPRHRGLPGMAPRTAATSAAPTAAR